MEHHASSMFLVPTLAAVMRTLSCAMLVHLDPKPDLLSTVRVVSWAFLLRKEF